MTNIMAVTVGYRDGKNAVYVCTDSQGTSWQDKQNLQKLFRRGGNLIASTGSYKRLTDAVRDLKELKDGVEPSYVCQRILDFGKANFRFKDENDWQIYVVVGMESGKPTIYSVGLGIDSLNPNSGVEPIWRDVTRAFHGSGSRQTAPAVQRDIETGNTKLDDLTEGMSFVFSLANRADIDLFVNDRLQIGLVTPDQTRLLYHPVITSDGGLQDSTDYFRVNFGISEKQPLPKDLGDLNHLRAGLNDLYHALLVSCRGMEIEDRDVNAANTAAKTDLPNREKHEAERQNALKRRDERKVHVTDLVDSWTSGDFSKLSEALKRYHDRREEMYDQGAQALEKLRTKNQVSEKLANGGAELGGEKAPF